MSTIELPRSSSVIVILAAILAGAGLIALYAHDQSNVWVFLLAFFVSGYVADLFTGVAHFCFDYVFPYQTPIFGPISREFTEHHDEPTLDPSNYLENLTKGGFASIPVSLLALTLIALLPDTIVAFALVSVLVWMSIWALFFHQIHSYAHMGCHMRPNVFKRRVDEIARLPNKKAQVDAFAELFAEVQIPRPIRFLQRCRILLTPERHNIHHIAFESDFSSVNGWSDPVLNLIVRPLARRYKGMTNRMR